MSTLFRMLAEVGADIRPLVTGLNQATSEVQKTSVQIQSALTTMNRAFSTLGVTLSAAALTAFTRSAYDMAGSLIDLAEVTGFSTTSLQELRFAAMDSGASAEQLEGALQKYTVRLADVINGNGELAETFEKYGISARDANGELRDADAILNDVANAIMTARTEQDKLSLATDFFGKDAAPAMVRMLKDGAAGLDAFRERAQEMGLVMDEALIKRADEAVKRFDALWYSLEVHGKQAVLSTIDYFQMQAAQMDRMNLKFSGTLTDQINQMIDQRNKLQAEMESGGVIDWMVGGMANKKRAAEIDELNTYINTLQRQRELLRQSGLETEKQQPSWSGPLPSGKPAAPAAQAPKTRREEKAEIDSVNGALRYQVELLEDVKESGRDTFRDLAREIQSSGDVLDSLKKQFLSFIADVSDSIFSLATGGSTGTGIAGALVGKLAGGLFGAVTATSGPKAGQLVIPSFDVGSNYIPRDMLAMVHQGERIMTASENRAYSNSAAEPIVVNQHLNFSLGVSQTVKQEIAQLMPQIQKSAVSAVLSSSKRGVMDR